MPRQGLGPSHLPPLDEDADCTLESGARRLDGRLKSNDFVSRQQRHHSSDPEDGQAYRRQYALTASSGQVFLGDGLSWRRSSKANVRSAVFAQAVVDGGDPRQRKISELDTLVIGRKQNDAREHVANLADHLGQGCVLYVCHGPPKFWSYTAGRSPLLMIRTSSFPFGMIQPDGIFVFPIVTTRSFGDVG